MELSTEDPVPGPSGIQKPSTGGRPSKESLGIIARAFKEMNEIWADLSNVTGKPIAELRRRYEKSTKGANEHRHWNTYLRYFSKNTKTESQRLNRPYENSQEFRSACYAQYKKDIPDWEKALDVIYELEFSMEEKTIGQRKKEYEKFEKRLNDLVCALGPLALILILIGILS
jgi:DNA mismatch repair ATPase MutS